jgi:hypothetical protein
LLYNGDIGREARDMAVAIITFKNKPIRVQHNLSGPQNLKLLKLKLHELELDFEFRKKLKKLSTVELINDVAIFIYNDGTKLYLEVS